MKKLILDGVHVQLNYIFGKSIPLIQIIVLSNFCQPKFDPLISHHDDLTLIVLCFTLKTSFSSLKTETLKADVKYASPIVPPLLNPGLKPHMNQTCECSWGNVVTCDDCRTSKCV